MTPPVARHVWLNGRLLPSDVPHLSVYDRGFQLGDGVFEALRARRGVPIEFDGHMARLAESAAAMDFRIQFSDAELRAAVEELLAAEGLDGAGGEAATAGDATVRITISRGYNPTRGVLPDPDPEPSVAVQVWPFEPPAARVLAEGERAISSKVPRDPESPMSAIKSTSRAELVYARIEARRAGVDDAVFLTPDGRVTEATTANVLVFNGDECATPKLSCGILAGTTRAWLMGHGPDVGLQMVERDIALDEVYAADELAFCASIGGVIPVTELNGRRIGDGRPGRRTLDLRAARERWIDEVSRDDAAARAAGSGSAARAAR